MAEVELSFEEHVDALSEALGERHAATYTFGRTELTRGRKSSFPRLLVVVDRIDQRVLDQVSEVVTLGMQAGIYTRLAATDNLLRGADTFPAFALELMDSRVLVKGHDVLSELRVEPAQLRLNIEHGLRGLHRGVVRGYLSRGLNGDNIPKLRRVTRKLIYLLEATLLAAQKEVPQPATAAALIDAATSAMLSEPKTEAWEIVCRFAQGEFAIKEAHVIKLYGALIDALTQMIDAVDRLEPAG